MLPLVHNATCSLSIIASSPHSILSFLCPSLHIPRHPGVGNYRSSTICSAAIHRPHLPNLESAAIRTKNLWLWSPQRLPLLCDINLAVPPGTLHMLVGRNAAGKSTLLRVLRRLVLPDAGSIHIAEPAAYVAQDPNLLLAAPTVGSDVAFSVGGMGTRVREVRKQVLQCLSWVGLGEEYVNKKNAELSGGQRQRVVVASALASNPRVFLLDEVTANMDLENRFELLERMRHIVKERAVSALWVTHISDELEFADDISVMEKGFLVVSGSAQDRHVRAAALKITDYQV